MPKTYNTFTNVSTGDVLTATNFNNVLTNIANYRVPPMALVRRASASNQSLTTSPTTLAWNNTTAAIDTDTMWSSGANTQLTIGTTGVYVVTAQVVVSFAGTMTRTGLRVASSVNAYELMLEHPFSNSYGYSTMNLSGPITLSAGATLSVVFEWAGGTSVSLLADQRTFLSAVWVGQAS